MHLFAILYLIVFYIAIGILYSKCKGGGGGGLLATTVMAADQQCNFPKECELIKPYELHDQPYTYAIKCLLTNSAQHLKWSRQIRRF